MKINILDMLEESAKKFPNKIAFGDEKRSVTYAEVISEAKKIGSRLAQYGTHNTPIAVILPKSVEMLICFWGILYSGNYYVPIDTKMPQERINIILESLQPTAVIVDEKNVFQLEKYKTCNYEDAIAFVEHTDILCKIRSSMVDVDPAYALFTSGSTGVPKGVIVCHRSVIDYAKWVVETFHFDQTTILGNQTPFYFSMSVLDIYATICSGAALHIIPSQYFTFISDLVEFLNSREVNAIYWVPSALCLIAKFRLLEKVELPFLNKILFAGEVMPTKQLNYWRKYLPNALYANLFGPTEITDIGAYYVLNRDFADDEPIPIGNACRNMDIFVLDSNSQLVDSTDTVTTGELYFRGSFLAHGYLNLPGKTKEVFVQHPLNNQYPEIVYKSGDLVRWNKYGELVYVSRKDNQIKHMGNRIELGEIETAASAISGMDRCAVIYDSEEDVIALFYQNKECDIDEIKAELKKRLPIYMMPGKYLKVKAMPLNDNGKIDRLKLLTLI